jgi:hypothetical protein
MAIRTKTVVFATPSLGTTGGDNVQIALDQITIHIPEANPVFRSVFVETAFRDAISATGGTITSHGTSLRLGAGLAETITETDDITNTGENIGGVLGPWDFTAYFLANWSGTSMTCNVQVVFDQTTGTGLGMRNVSAMIFVTYDYDDAAATQVKTVRLPMESLTGALPTTMSNFGSNQIPQLTGVGGILPEAGVTIRDWFVVLEGNNSASGSTTDWQLFVQVDGALPSSFGVNEMGLASDVFDRWIYKPIVDHAAIPDPSAQHQFQARGSQARANHLTATLYVTYEFTLAGTSRILNSVFMPIEVASPLGAATAAEASRFARQFLITEPGTITLRQSGFRINYNLAASAPNSWRAGGQAYRLYTSNANVVAGMFSTQQRIDAGSAQGAGISLARGFNDVTIDGFTSSTINQMTNLNGYLLINYESDVPAQGIGSAVHTVLVDLLDWNAGLTDRNRINNWEPPFFHDNYWIVASGFCFIKWVQSASMAVTFDVECAAGESKGGGYLAIYGDAYQSDNERACSVIWMRGRDVFRRFPEDADPDRLDPFQLRDYRLFTTAASSNGMLAAYTYHQMTWTVAGNLTNLDAAEDLELVLVRAVDDQPLQRQTYTAGSLPSSFTFTVYDNVIEYYVVAQQVTRASRSLSGVAV